MEAQGTILPAAKQVLPGNTLYLRIPSDSAISMITPVLQRSPGAVTVVLYIESTGAKLACPAEPFRFPHAGIDSQPFGYAGHEKRRVEIKQLSVLTCEEEKETCASKTRIQISSLSWLYFIGMDG